MQFISSTKLANSKTNSNPFCASTKLNKSTKYMTIILILFVKIQCTIVYCTRTKLVKSKYKEPYFWVPQHK